MFTPFNRPSEGRFFEALIDKGLTICCRRLEKTVIQTVDIRIIPFISARPNRTKDSRRQYSHDIAVGADQYEGIRSMIRAAYLLGWQVIGNDHALRDREHTKDLTASQTSSATRGRSISCSIQRPQKDTHATERKKAKGGTTIVFTVGS